MNRIVLIGNGFDLAHGLRTSYEDFFFWCLKQYGYSLLHTSSREVSDGLCSFKIKEGVNVPNWASAFNGWYFKRENPLIPWTENDAFFNTLEDKELCDFSFTSQLFKRIWNRLLLGWVDIENEYFSLLTEEKMSFDKGFVKPNYKELNKHLEILRGKLIQYLKLESEKEIPIIDNFSDIIYRPIKEREVSVAYKKSLGKNAIGDIVPSATMLLNFNYTRTPENYLSEFSNAKINYIHGNLDDPESVIFGYGDELDSDFKKLQNMNDNECMRHIKSIRYLESDNYRKMLEFIESDTFQVVIMGHSCGLSDRTLLNTLFEHDNCVSIMPYYHDKGEGKDDYLDKVQNISRNFTNPQLMRDRVVNKTFCEPLPQFGSK